MDKIIASGSEPPAVAGGLTQNDEHQILTESGFFWRERDGVKVLICRPLADAGFTNGFSTRTGGVSPFPGNSLNLAGFDEDTAENIYENRRRFLNVFDADYQLATAWQVHGDGVKIVTSENITDSEERFDSLTSQLNGVLVGVKTADCVPVLIGDPATNSFAAVHAGWRGTVQSIVVKAVERMRREFGSNALDLIVAVGPHATHRNYEVGGDVIEEFQTRFPGCDHYFEPTRKNHARINLSMANEEQLLRLGVRPRNLKVAPFCTMERPDLFFSYRLEKSRYGKTGRLMSVIGRK